MLLPLEGYRLLDLADEKGAHCTKTLAELGVDVVKLEPPDGDPMRRIPPFARDVPHPEGSLFFAYYNTSKRSITLNLESAAGRVLLKRLVSRFDLMVESFSPGTLARLGLDYNSLREVNKSLILTSITGFGQTGPHSHYKAPDLISFAMGGPMYTSGEAGREPCVAPGNLAYGVAGAWAAAGTIIALYHRAATGEGQHIDVSAQEAAAMITDSALTRLSCDGIVASRQGNTYLSVTPGDLYPCKDGWVRIVAGQIVHWRRLVSWMGHPKPFDNPEWENRELRNKNKAFVDQVVSHFTCRFTCEEIFVEGQRLGVPVSPVNTPLKYMNSAVAKARGFFVELEHSVLGRHLYARPPYKFTETPARDPRPAPLLGQHNEEIYCGELGFSRNDLCVLRAEGAI